MLVELQPTGSSASGVVSEGGRIETVLLHDRVEPGREEPAQWLRLHTLIRGE